MDILKEIRENFQNAIRLDFIKLSNVSDKIFVDKAYAETIKSDTKVKNLKLKTQLNDNSTIEKGLSEIELYETRIFCIVNKYNQIVKSTTRIFSSNEFKSKPIYWFFVSKHDAIDFIYFIAKAEPKLFKNLGLGINSFSLKQYFALLEKNKDAIDMLIVNDLNELEDFAMQRTFSSPDVKCRFAMTMRFVPCLEGILTYKLTSFPRNSPERKILFFRRQDALDFWKKSLKNSSLDFRNSRAKIKIELIPYQQLKEFYSIK